MSSASTVSSTYRSAGGLSLHTRVGLVLCLITASLLALLGGLWLQGTRSAIHEEVEAATRVSAQWLKVVLADLEARPADEQGTRLLAVAASVGRVRAHQLEIRDGAGVLRHVSPPPTYKVGRAAPEWFADLMALDLPARQFALGDLRLSLHPDASRAVLDAWDELLALAGWGLLLLVALFAAARVALARALSPLEQVMGALDRTGAGRFDTRLPGFSTPELARLSRAFNGMADRLQAAVNDNVRLDTQRELAERMQARLAAERRDIARELHDELAQGITAVRALAGAIVQRASDESALHVPAQGIVAVTGEMQDGVRRILQRLRPPAAGLGDPPQREETRQYRRPHQQETAGQRQHHRRQAEVQQQREEGDADQRKDGREARRRGRKAAESPPTAGQRGKYGGNRNAAGVEAWRHGGAPESKTPFAPARRAASMT